VTKLPFQNLHLPNAHVHCYIWAGSQFVRRSRASSQDFPFGSVMPYGLDNTAVRFFLITQWPCTRKTSGGSSRQPAGDAA